MAYRPTEIGEELFYGDPRKGAARLAELYAEHGTRAAVAGSLGVSEHTVGRWLVRIRALGLPLPARRSGRGRPRKAKVPTSHASRRNPGGKEAR